jgi:glycosyltransferase involved in cell wall biosynthesis
VLASIHEGLPIAILEAMAAGKPIVATRVGSVSQVVINGETGLLVKPGEAGALSEALRILVSDKVERQRLGANGFELVCAHYSFDRTIGRYTTLYDKVLRGAKLAKGEV